MERYSYFALFFFTCIFLPFVLFKGLFSAPKSIAKKGDEKLSLFSVIIAFILYIAIAGLLPFFTLRYFQDFGFNSFRAISAAQLFAFVMLAIVLVCFTNFQSNEVKARIWGKKDRFWIYLLIGCGLTICVFPICMFLVQTIHNVLEFIGIRPEQEQIAVSQMKSLQTITWLFWCYAVAIVTIIPLIEELLFRGFLQSFLVDIFGVKPGIICASIVFAGFHFSTVQGSSNIELLIGLFLMSYFIGISYLKRNSLFVAVGMHGMFNALSFSLMFLKLP